MTTPKRRHVIVDVESSGLTDDAVAVEIAWWDVDTGERGSFIPRHDEAWVREHGHPDALAINGYWDRIAGRRQDDGTEVRRLHHALRGQCIVGCNIGRADCAWLVKVFQAAGLHPEPWNYRLGELGPYAAGVLGIRLSEAPGLGDICTAMGVDPEPEVHTAANGVAATGLALKALLAKAGGGVMAGLPTVTVVGTLTSESSGASA